MTAEATVTEIINDSRTYASTTYDLATDIVQTAITAASGFSYPIQYQFTFDADQIGEPNFPIAPAGFSDNYNVVTPVADIGTFEPVYVPEIPTFPTAPDELDTSALFTYSRPVWDIDPFGETPPTVSTSFTLPTAPSLPTLDAPVVTSPTLPTAPDVVIPTFDEEFEGIDPTAIADLASRYEDENSAILPVIKDFVESNIEGFINTYAPEYHNALAKLEAKISNDMDGGTAMSDAIEQQIFDRAKQRAEQEKVRLDREVMLQASKRGFDIIPGTVLSGLRQNQQAIAGNISTVAAETAIERARLEQQHIEFVMNMSNQIRNYMVTSILQYASVLLNCNQQAQAYAKDICMMLVEEYNATLRLYEAKMRLYEVLANVYDVRVRSALAEIEEYRIKVDAAKLELEVDRLEVEMYSQQINAQKTLVDIYTAQLRGVITEAELEKLKVEIFGSQVETYMAEVKAKVAEFDVYKAAIAGDQARVAAYGTQVDAYRANIAAIGTKVDAEKAISQVSIEANRNIIEQYRAELSGYIAEVDAEGKRYTSSVQAYTAALEAYKTDLEAQLQAYRVKYEKAKLDLDAATVEYQGENQRRIKVAEMFQDHISLQANTALGASQVAASIAGASLNAVNSMVNLTAEAI